MSRCGKETVEGDRRIEKQETVSELFVSLVTYAHTRSSSELLRETAIPVQAGIVKTVAEQIQGISVVFTAFPNGDKVSVYS